MKTFFYLCTLLALTAGSAPTEDDLLNYIRVNSHIRSVLASMSTFMYNVIHQAQQISEHFDKNITLLHTIYGRETSRLFQLKYKAKAAEFTENPKLNATCATYVKDLLRKDEEHQTELSKYIDTAYRSWKTGINNLYRKLISIRFEMTSVVKKAYDCHLLFSGNNPSAAYLCVYLILDKLEQFEVHEMNKIHDEAGSLIRRHNIALMKLNKSVNNQSMSSFYKQTETDDWMKTFCKANSRESPRRA